MSGNKGTYILIGYLINPSLIQNETPQYLINHLNQSYIQSGIKEIQGLV
ncbi:DUF929 family protein [Stygiolobus sp. CP850M]